MVPHAIQRAEKRLHGGRAAAYRAVSALKAAVLAGKVHFVGPGKLPCRAIWRVWLRSRWVRFVWDETLQLVVTVLPTRRRPRRGEL